MPVLVRADNFESEVLEAKLPVLVDFFGERCMPCRLLRPTLLELGEEYAGQLKICMFNTEREPEETKEEYHDKFRTALTYGVMNLPTMLLFIDGKLRRTLIGLHTKQELLDIFLEEDLRLTPRQPNENDPGDSEEGGGD